MVEVVTKEEFAEFEKLIEDRLDKMDKSRRKILDDLTKAFGDLTASVDKDCVAINKRLDEVEAKSKSFWTRLQEAVKPVPE